MKNKINFGKLIVTYFIVEVLLNSFFLIGKWLIDGRPNETNSQIAVDLTASFIVRALHALLINSVYFVVMNLIKRKGHDLHLNDAKLFIQSFKNRDFLALFLSDVLISSPYAVMQALLPNDPILSIIYYELGFFLNWLFGLVHILILEDNSIPITTVFVWCVHSTFSPQTFLSVLVCHLVVFATAPLILFTPVCIVFQIITFYEIFGFSSAAEVHLST